MENVGWVFTVSMAEATSNSTEFVRVQASLWDTPPRLTQNLKMMVWKMFLLFQGCILRFHVNLPGCTRKMSRLIFRSFGRVHLKNWVLGTRILGTLLLENGRKLNGMGECPGPWKMRVWKEQVDVAQSIWKCCWKRPPPQEGIFLVKLLKKEVYSHPQRDHNKLYWTKNVSERNKG